MPAKFRQTDKRKRLEELLSVLDGQMRDVFEIAERYSKRFHKISPKMVRINLMELHVWFSEGKMTMNSRVRCHIARHGYLFWKEEGKGEK